MSSIPIPMTKNGMTKIRLHPSYPIYDNNPNALVKPKTADIIPADGRRAPGDVTQFVLIDINKIENMVIKVNVPVTKNVSNVILATISVSNDFDVAYEILNKFKIALSFCLLSNLHCSFELVEKLSNKLFMFSTSWKCK